MYSLSSISSSVKLSLVALVLLAGWARADQTSTNNNEFLGGSAELQSVNSYLTGIPQGISMDPSEVIRHLEHARAIVDAAGDDAVRHVDELEEAEPNVRSLFDNNPDSLRTILDSLIRASNSCDQESTDFMSLVKSQTFDGQFLHSYSQSVADKCVQAQAERIAKRVEISLNKVSSELYELMGDLSQAYAARERKTKAGPGQIVIEDKQKSIDPKELIRNLRALKLDSPSEQQLFATMIRNYYADQFPTGQEERVTARMRRDRLRNFFIDSLIDPCAQLTARWTETINYPASVGTSRRPIAESIERRRRANPMLDRSVEMVRVCRRMQSNSDAILALVEK